LIFLLAWLGLAWLGLAWPGLAWPGLAWPGWVLFSEILSPGAEGLSAQLSWHRLGFVFWAS